MHNPHKLLQKCSLAMGLFAAGCLLISNCSRESPLGPGENIEVDIEIILPGQNGLLKATSVDHVSRVSLEVTAMDATEDFTKIDKDLQINGNVATGTVELQRGRNRIFLANAFDDQNRVVYCDADTTDTLEDGFVVNLVLKSKRPAAVQLMAKDVTSRSVTLVWQRNTDSDFASYKLYRDSRANVDMNSTLIYETANNADTEFVDQGLLPDTDYRYKIHVLDTAGLEASSNEVEVSTLTPPDIVIRNVSAPDTVTAGDSIRVSWDVVNLGTEEVTVPGYKDLVTISSLNPGTLPQTGVAEIPNLFLGAEASVPNSVRLKIPTSFSDASAGIKVVGDSENVVVEDDESNNRGEITIFVQPATAPSK